MAFQLQVVYIREKLDPLVSGLSYFKHPPRFERPCLIANQYVVVAVKKHLLEEGQYVYHWLGVSLLAAA